MQNKVDLRHCAPQINRNAVAAPCAIGIIPQQQIRPFQSCPNTRNLFHFIKYFISDSTYPVKQRSLHSKLSRGCRRRNWNLIIQNDKSPWFRERVGLWGCERRRHQGPMPIELDDTLSRRSQLSGSICEMELRFIISKSTGPKGTLFVLDRRGRALGP